MKHAHFLIKNFKGIKRIDLDLASKPSSRFFTLVGLNESGKTTVLEALNFLNYQYIGRKQESLGPLELPGYAIKDVHELIPIAERDNFNDTVEIVATFDLDEEDQRQLTQYASQELGIIIQNVGKLIIRQAYKFEASKIAAKQPTSTYYFKVFGKAPRARTFRQLGASDTLKLIGILKLRLPSVLYFPNFFFEFPDRIYLQDPPEDEDKHEFYRGIIQDVLDAMGTGMDIRHHILDRAISGGPNEKRALATALHRMGQHMTSTVFEHWNHIFRRSLREQEIVLDCDRDENGLWFLQIQIKDANGIYAISDRSLGFRWFFAFLLLTYYRTSRKDAPGNVLFLLDEPASNLHPSAQSQLLHSFSNLPANISIVYATHSHHMINPAWLEGAFVVRNTALDYNDEDTYNARDTKITVEPYRKFAAAHPNQSTYFKPILDVLDYSPSQLDNVPDVVMVEGKTDFYTLKYFNEVMLGSVHALNLMPGGGAGSLEPVCKGGQGGSNRLSITWIITISTSASLLSGSCS